MYSIVLFFGPTVLGEAGLEASSGAQHAACEFGWTFADDSCIKLFGDGVLGEPLGWVDAEEACQAMDSQTHLASVTSAEQQVVVARLAAGTQLAWIGLSDSAEEGSFVWSDDAPLGYSNWVPDYPNGDGNAVALVGSTSKWLDIAETTPPTRYPYIAL